MTAHLVAFDQLLDLGPRQRRVAGGILGDQLDLAAVDAAVALLQEEGGASSCCLPPAASGPVLTVRNPMRSGSDDCANTRRDGRMLIAAPAARSVRRDIFGTSFLPDISYHPVISRILIGPTENQENDEPIRPCGQASPQDTHFLRYTSSVLNSPTRLTGAFFSHFAMMGLALSKPIELV